MIYSKNNQFLPTCFLLRTVGYGLILFVLFDIIDIIVPLRLMNPVWEFQTIGALVERVPLPLIGLVLVFYKEESCRLKWEAVILQFLSQTSLLVGVLFLLLIPLCISNTIRINNINNQQIDTQISQYISQIQQIEQNLNVATEKDFLTLLSRINSQNSSPEIKNPQELKNYILMEVEKTESNLKAQAVNTRKDKTFGLIKNTIKWCVGALIAGSLFIRVWQASRWARAGKKTS